MTTPDSGVGGASASPVVARRAQRDFPNSIDPDQDTADLPTGVDEDALDQDEIDTTRITADPR